MMQMFYQKYRNHIMIVLVAVILILLLIIFTDMHVARINREMHELSNP